MRKRGGEWENHEARRSVKKGEMARENLKKR